MTIPRFRTRDSDDPLRTEIHIFGSSAYLFVSIPYILCIVQYQSWIFGRYGQSQTKSENNIHRAYNKYSTKSDFHPIPMNNRHHNSNDDFTDHALHHES